MTGIAEKFRLFLFLPKLEGKQPNQSMRNYFSDSKGSKGVKSLLNCFIIPISYLFFIASSHNTQAETCAFDRTASGKTDLVTQPLAINACPTPVSPNVIVCTAGEVSLSATGASGTQVYKWYASASGSTVIGTGSPFTYNVTASTSLFVSISDTNCESPRDEVIITLTSNPPGPSTTNGASCGPGTATLIASSTLPNPVYEWFDSPFAGNLVFTGSSYPVNLTTVSDTFFVRVVAGACSSSRTFAIAKLKQIPPAPVISDATRCGAGSVTLAPTLPTGATAKWYADSLPTTPAFFAGPVFTTPSFSGTIFYFVSTLLSGCESLQREKVYVYYNLGPPLTGAQDVARCQPGVFQLSANTDFEATVHWYDSSNGGTELATGPTFTTPSLSQTTSYWVSARDAGGCEGARQEIKAVIVSAPSPPLGSDVFRCGPGSVSITVEPISGFTAQWYAEPTGGSPFFSGSTYDIPQLTSDVTYYVSAAIPGCESDRKQITASVKPVPAALNSDTSDRCEPGELVLQSSSSGQIRWYSDPAGNNFISEGNNLVVNVQENTTFYASTRDGNGCESTPSPFLAKINQVNLIASPSSIISGESSLLSCDAGKTYSWTPASSLSSSNTQAPTAKPSLTTLYSVTVTYESGCTLSDTATVFVTGSQIPNVFTPNGDKIFDTWEIPGAIKNTSNKLTVFNRWGSIVKEETGYKNDWDGSDVPSGTYYYKYDEGTGKPAISGTITIVK